MDYYTKHIQSNADWSFVGVYADEGISATNTKKRDGFNRMVSDAMSGKIDLILTKSVSRFARNTVDSLTAVRQLKEKGVEVYFEKENIYTLDSKGELLITIMSSLAQEESRSISENVRWGQHKRMQDGKVSMPYKHFLGYEKGLDGKPSVIEAEATIVRAIYARFMSGYSFREIADWLMAEGVSTPTGKTLWHMSTVKSILQNEKYTGNAILQKKYTVDFLTKRQKTNEGEIPQYYVENSHPAIIPSSEFELVQDEIRRREQFCKQIRPKLFSGQIICGECGGYYGPKVWHSKDQYRRVIWRCNARYSQRGRLTCNTPHLTEEAVKSVFVRAWEAMLADKDRYIAQCETELADLIDSATLALDKQTAVLTAECAETAALVEDCIAANAASALNQAEYQKRYAELVARYDSAKAQLDELKAKRLKDAVRKERISRLLTTLRQSDNIAPQKFDEHLWRETVEAIIIYSLDDVRVRFCSSTEIRVNTNGV